MKVHFFATYRQIIGGREIEIPAAPGLTVRALVDALVARYPDLRREWLDEHGELYSHVHLFVNGRQFDFLPDGIQTGLTDADVVKIFPPVGGG
jgi:MoaD family protein